MDRNHNVDWKRNNKVAIRNFSDACDLHDVVKLLLVKLLRRNYTNSKSIPIYTEYEFDDNYPDVWMKIKGDIYVWEIQERLSEKWTKKMIDKYREVNLNIIPLDKFNGLSISEIKKLLEVYLI